MTRIAWIIGLAVPALATAQDDPVDASWQAFWVWGSRNMDRGDGFFRLTFEVDGEPVAAVLQGSGDDAYDLFINGQHVRSSGFAFLRTDTIDLLPHLRPGRNVLAAVCHNAAFPGGWLAQLTVTYADGRQVNVVSDRNTRFWHEEQPGWADLDFDDSKWEACRELARPPQGVWGPLPLSYAGVRRRLELVSLDAPSQVEAGALLKVSAVVRPLEPLRPGEELSVRLMRATTCLGSAKLLPSEDTGTWRVARDVSLGPLEMVVHRYASSGPATLEVTLSRCTFEGVGPVIQQDIYVSGREGTVGVTPARVADYLGAPALFIAGRPRPAMLYLQGSKPVSAEYGQMAAAGYEVFSLGLPMGWVGPDQYDYTRTDEQMLAALAGAPEGFFIPRVDVSAPEWWCDLHPEEVVGCADGTGYVMDVWGGTKHQSFASERWRREAGEALRRLIRHIQQSPYAGRVIGYHVATGIYGEWHLWSPEHLPDTSEAMRQAFIRWCRGKYADDLGRLNRAWGTELKSFEEITCATQEERLAADLGAFKDLSRSCRVSDYWQCLHETTVSAIAHFCHVVKEATQGQAMAGAFYAYLEDIGWPQEGGHLAARAAYEHPDIDFFSSPHSYTHRGLGEGGGFRAYPASIRMAGKLFIDEGDDRTHLSGDYPYMHATNADQSASIMRREVLNALTLRVGMWWFDMTTGWFNDPLLLDTAARLRAAGERALQRPADSWAQVAVAFDPTTYYAMADWTAHRDPLSYHLANQQLQTLRMVGAPYDVLLVDDLLRPEAEAYRCIVLLNTWHMTDAFRQKLAQRLQRDGRVVVFVYAPGFSSENGLDAAHMTELTGMELEMAAEGGSLRARWAQGVAGIEGLAPAEEWGIADAMAPRFSVRSGATTPLAEWADGGGVAAAIARHDGWTSLYCGTGPIPAPLLAHAYALAGVHLWTPAWQEGSNFYAGNGFFGVHTTTAGTRTFRLPWLGTVRDALTGQIVAERTDHFQVELSQHETAVYEVQRD